MARPGHTLQVERLQAQEGELIELSDVLLVADGETRIGNPTVPGARVIVQVLEHGRGRKVIAIKFKAKVRYRRKLGHRQPYTRLAVKEILLEPVAA